MAAQEQAALAVLLLLLLLLLERVRVAERVVALGLGAPV